MSSPFEVNSSAVRSLVPPLLVLGLIFCLFLSLLLCGCTPGMMKPHRSADQAQVRIYLQVLSPSGQEVRFFLEKVAAVRKDGSRVPLRLRIREIPAGEMMEKGELLVADSLPEGEYSGFSFTFGEAHLLGENGEGNLVVPEEDAFLREVFTLRREDGVVFELTIDLPASIEDEILFSPRMGIRQSQVELLSRTGFMTETATGSLLIFDKFELSLLDLLVPGGSIRGLAVDAGQARVYMADAAQDEILVADLHAREILWKISLKGGDAPLEVCLSAEGRQLFVSNHGSGEVSVIDTASLFELERIRVGEGPSFCATDEERGRLYVANAFSNTVTVIDLWSRQVVRTIQLDTRPVEMLVDPRSGSLFVSGKSPTLTVVDGSTLEISERLSLGTGGVALFLHPRTDLLYLALEGTGELAIFDSFSLAQLGSIALGEAAASLAYDLESDSLYALLPGKGVLAKVNLTRQAVDGELEVFPGYAVAIFSD